MKALVVLLVYLTWCCGSGYQISECGSDDKVDLDEARPTVLTCTGITDDTVKWEVERGDTNITAATCTLSTSTCSASFVGFEVEIPEHNTSRLTVTLKDRIGIKGMIRCGGSAIGSSSATCTIRIVNKVDKVSNCIISVNDRDWTVTASCDVDRMYASDGNYSCYWTVTSQNRMTKGSLSKTSFMENKKEYSRGTCSVSNLPMPTADGIYNYSVIIDPGVGQLSGPSLEIKQPDEPTLDNCPDYIREGRDVNCFCQASDSSPLSITTWFADISNPIRVLQLKRVNRSSDGTNYTCTQYWGGQVNAFLKRIVYTLRVKYFTTPATSTLKTTHTITTTTQGVNTDISTITQSANTEGQDKSDTDNDNEDEGLPIPIIAGVAVGGLVVVIIIFVIIVAVVKKSRGSPTEQRKGDTADDDFDEHINDLYESSDARPYAGTLHLLSGHNASNARNTTEPSTVNEESETAFGYPTVGSSAPQTTASAQQHNQILESDLYSTPDENGAQPPVVIATQAAPKGADVYAVVNKPDKNKPQENSVSER